MSSERLAILFFGSICSPTGSIVASSFEPPGGGGGQEGRNDQSIDVRRKHMKGEFGSPFFASPFDPSLRAGN
jgi:hypothetical protein